MRATVIARRRTIETPDFVRRTLTPPAHRAKALLPEPNPPHAVHRHATIDVAIGDLNEAAVASLETKLTERNPRKRRALGALIDGEFLHAIAGANRQRHVRRLILRGAEAEAELVAARARNRRLE